MVGASVDRYLPSSIQWHILPSGLKEYKRPKMCHLRITVQVDNYNYMYIDSPMGDG